jgi:hypothetical protein
MLLGVAIVEDRKVLVDATNAGFSNSEGKRMKRLWFLLMVPAVIFSLGVGFATADNPHFVRTDATVQSDGDLACSFKIAGLGTNETIEVTCAADASAFYACFNRGGKHPQASNKEESAGPVSGTGEFTSGQNGQVNGTLEVHPPPSNLSCPGNQVVRLCSLSYTNIDLTAVTATQVNLTANVPGTITRTFIDCF